MKTDLMNHTTALYAVGPDIEGPVKIGISKQLPRRVNYLGTSSPRPLKVHFVRFIPAKQEVYYGSMRQCFEFGARALEKLVHSKMRELDLWLRGEWFDISASDARAVVDKVMDMNGMRSIGVEDLCAADLTGRSDRAMEKAHRLLMHDAIALNDWAISHNALALGGSPSYGHIMAGRSLW